MADPLEERLREHAKAFDGLLSLIPAKVYYGEDTSDQWQRKKQTQEQRREAKRAKLDPDSAKSAKDVMDERGRDLKRKRDQDDEMVDSGDIAAEIPKEGLKARSKKVKKSMQQHSAAVTDENHAAVGTAPTDVSAAERKKRKAERQAAKKAHKKEKAAAQFERAQTKGEAHTAKRDNANGIADGVQIQSEVSRAGSAERLNDISDGANEEGEGSEIAIKVDITDSDSEEVRSPTVSSSDYNPSPAFETPQPQSGTSSISSIGPNPISDVMEAPGNRANRPFHQSSKPTTSAADLKIRLQQRIEALRAARHADGLDGKPAKNRQELLETRRRKEEERRNHKKELRRKAKEEEARRQDEEIARRFSPSNPGSLLASPRSPLPTDAGNSFSFGRIAFTDGTQADATLSSLLPERRKKGPSDPATALKAANSKHSRLTGLDDSKRADIEEKDMWLNAKKKAHGERVRDDTSLLKKALKRKDSVKKKSQKDWKERTEGVQKGQAMRQKKRDENLRKRQEEKGGGKGKKGGSKGGGKGGSKGGSKKVKRPGFEGSFKAKVGGRSKP